MKIRLDRDHFILKLDNEFKIFYLWWGIDPWSRFRGESKRSIEIGFGWWSKEILVIK